MLKVSDLEPGELYRSNKTIKFCLPVDQGPLNFSKGNIMLFVGWSTILIKNKGIPSEVSLFLIKGTLYELYYCEDKTVEIDKYDFIYE